MTSHAGRSPLEHPRVSTDLFASVVIVFLAATAPAFNVDDAAFFNYLNNVEGAHAFYYYNGYVNLIPEAVAYSVSALPLLAQVLLYRIVPLVLALLLYRETTLLFALQAPRAEAKLLALGVPVILRFTYLDMGAVLASAPWTALLIGALIVIRVNACERAYSSAMMAGVLLSAVAFPPGGLLAGLCGFYAIGTAERGRRLQNAMLALTIVAVHLWFASGFPDRLWNAAPAAIPDTFVTGFREHKLHNLLVLASLATLAAALRWGLARGRRDAVALGSLCFLGWGCSLAFIVSDRFVLYGGFEPQYAVSPVGCALVAVGWMVLSVRGEEQRAIRIGACAGVSVMVALMTLYGSLRGPLELALMKYRFVMIAGEERTRCRDEEVFVFEDEESSPIVFCRRQPLAGGKLRVADFVPAVGVGVADAEPADKPSIINPKPLF